MLATKIKIKEEPLDYEDMQYVYLDANLQEIKTEEIIADTVTSSNDYNFMNNVHEERAKIEFFKGEEQMVNVQVSEDKSEIDLNVNANIDNQQSQMNSALISKEVFKVICKICQQEFNDPINYSTHPTHKDKCDRQKCTVCPLAFDSIMELAEHFELHRSNRFFCKLYCGCHFETVEQCEEHEYDDHAAYNLKCSICSNKFSSRKTLIEHITTHAKRFVCSYCRQFFESSAELLLHWKMTCNSTCGRLMKNVHEITSNMNGSKPLETTVLPYRLKSATKKKSSTPTNCANAITSKRCRKTSATSYNELENFNKSKPAPLDDSMIMDPFIKVEVKNEPIDEEYDAEFPFDYCEEEPTEITCDVEIKTEPIDFNDYDEMITKIAVNNKNITIKDINGIQVDSNIVTAKDKSSSPSIKLQIPSNPLTLQKIPTIAKIPNNNAKFIPIEAQGLKVFKIPANIRIVTLPNNGGASTSSLLSMPKLPNNFNNIIPTNITLKKKDPGFVSAEAKQLQAVLEELKQEAEENDRNLCLPKRLLNLIDNLPEKRELIENIKQQIKYAEKSMGIDSINGNMPLQEVKTVIKSENLSAQPINSVATLQSTSKAAAVDVLSPPTFQLPVVRNYDGELLEARRHYPNFRFVWCCPKCPRVYEQKNAFHTHLVIGHSMCREDLEKLIIEVKPEPKKTVHKVSIPVPSAAVIPTNICSVSASAVVAAASTVAAVPIVKPVDIALPTSASKSGIDKNDSTSNGTRRIRGHECHKCGRVCSSRTMLDDHIRGNCSRIPQYSCTQCPKNFFSASTLACHMSIHTGELPHKCNYCDKRFRTRGQVTVHHRTHTGERPFTCEICSQSFTHRETLISHLSRHIGMKRYKCYGCNTFFSCISGLRVHRDIRPDTCGKVKFNSRAVGPRIRVIKGTVVFEPQPVINPYLRTEDPAEILSEIQNQQKQ